MRKYITNNKCLLLTDDHGDNKITLGYFDNTNQIEKVLYFTDSEEYIINGWMNISFEDRKKLDKVMFEIDSNDKISYYLYQFLGKDKKYEIKDDKKTVTFYRDDEYNIYIIFYSKDNICDINDKFKIRVKGNYRLYNLFKSINDNLNVEDHQMTIDEYLYEKKLK